MRSVFGAGADPDLNEDIVAVHLAGTTFQYEAPAGVPREANRIYLFLSEETGLVVSGARSGRPQDGFNELGTATAIDPADT